MTNYWQISAGSDGRKYRDYFLKHGIAFVGHEYTAMDQVKVGDRLVLKQGKSKILAVGEVVDCGSGHNSRTEKKDCEDRSKSWLQDFDGWNLSAYCYVDWKTPLPEHDTNGAGLTIGALKGIDQQQVKQRADAIIQSGSLQTVLPEPEPADELKDDEILNHLIKRGLRVSAAGELTETMKRIRLLTQYYYDADGFGWSDVREHEARTFLIIPFLLALGWSEQQLKIELGITGGKIDIAGFRRPYKRRKGVDVNDDCVLIIESKGFSQGLDYAHTQGKGYAKHFKNCKLVITSNGFCYKAYRQNDSGDGYGETAAYLNLLRPTKSYPLAPDQANSGGLDLLNFLLPVSAE